MEILKSRTVWTLAFMLVFNSMYVIEPFLSPETYTLVNTMMTALAGYFRINPRQQF